MARKRKSKELVSSAINQSPSGDSPTVKRVKLDGGVSQARPQNQAKKDEYKRASPTSTGNSQANSIPRGGSKRKAGLPQCNESLQVPRSEVPQQQQCAAFDSNASCEATKSGSPKALILKANTTQKPARRKRRQQQKEAQQTVTDTAKASQQTPLSHPDSDQGKIDSVARTQPSHSALTKKQRREIKNLGSASGTSSSAVDLPAIKSNTKNAIQLSSDQGSQIGASQPPPSSTKRRRRKGRKSLGTSRAVHDRAHSPIQKLHPLDDPTVSQPFDKSKSSVSPRAELIQPSEELRQLVSQTALPRRPVKEWVSELPEDGDVSPQSQPGGCEVESDVQFPRSPALYDDHADKDRRAISPLPVPEDPTHFDTKATGPQEPPQSAQRISTQSSFSSNEANEIRPSSHSSHSSSSRDEKILPLNSHTRPQFQSPQQSKLTGIGAIKQRLMAARQQPTAHTSPGTQRKDSAKANSIPSFNVAKDPEKAFKRFAAFTHGKDADNSDDSESDSSSSSSDSSDDDDITPNNANNIQQSVPAPFPRQTPNATTDLKAESAENNRIYGSHTVSPRKSMSVKFMPLECPPTKTIKAIESKPLLKSCRTIQKTSAFNDQEIVDRDDYAACTPAVSDEMDTDPVKHRSCEIETRASQERMYSSPRSDVSHKINSPSKSGSNLNLAVDTSAYPGWDVVEILPDTRDILQPFQPHGKALHASTLLSDEDLHRSINDISEAVFKSTLSLPPSKTLDRLHYSERGLTQFSRHFPRTITHTQTFPGDLTRQQYGMDVICNSVLLPPEQFSRSGSRDGLQTTPALSNSLHSDDTSSNSSSSLEQLSRSPSPPYDIAKSLSKKGNPLKGSIDVSELSSAPLEPLANSKEQEIWDDVEQNNTEGSQNGQANLVDQNMASTKKRSMTGITSRHFSPVKKTPKRSRRENVDPPEQHMPLEEKPYPEGPRTRSKARELEHGGHDTQSSRRTKSRQANIRKLDLNEADNESQSAYSQDNTSDNSEDQSEVSKKARVRSKSDKIVAKRTRSRKTTDETHLAPPKNRAASATPSPAKTKRIAGVSMAPAPPISADRFGLVQERLWREPFKLLVACLFLNQTAGKYAMPVFFSLIESYPAIPDLANANESDLFDRIAHLGFGNQRSRKCINLARTWLQSPPELGKRYRAENYPQKGDHKGIGKNDVLEDATNIAGAIEIAHLPGCGPYAYDSWRIFCRDVARGVADDYNGLNARIGGKNGEDFEPEWKRVLPKDKELRACLRWMWLREGWIWNAETGERRQADEEEMEAARRGQMEVEDEKERKFAQEAVAAQDSVDTAQS